MIRPIRHMAFRAFQGVMKLGARLLPIRVPRLLTGPGSVRQLPAVVAQDGVRHVLVVTDRVLMGLKLPEGLFRALEERGIRFSVFDEVEPNPTIDTIERGLQVYLAQQCDGLLAFGGGSPIDCAKVIGARVAHPRWPVRRMRGTLRLWKALPPLYAVPTTAGTGSETTIVAVVTDATTHEKYAISSLPLVPRVAVLDPELMLGLPPHITAATGMDALTHAVEAYIGRNGTAFTNRHAEDATRLIFEHLARVYRDGADLEGRTQLALASYYAGLAFTRAYVGYVHAIAHNLGGLYGVPHGLANAVILPYVLDFCRQEAQPQLARLAIAGGLGRADEPPAALAARFIEKIRALNQAMAIPTSIRELREQDLPLLVRRVLQEAHPEYPVPRIMTPAECEALIRQLLPGGTAAAAPALSR